MAVPTVSYGSNSSLDLLKSNFQTVAEIGENKAFDAINSAAEAHNMQVQEMVEDIVEVTTEREMLYGTAQVMQMARLDQHGSAPPQKILPGALCAFPLHRFGGALQWNRIYFLNATGDELAGQVTGMFDADARNILAEIKKAFFLHTNYTDVDLLASSVSQIPLPVKRLVNADGLGLPSGPNGELFDGSSHTHYMGVATGGTIVDADVVSGLNNLLEHYNKGEARIYINQAQEVAFRALTNFVKFYDPSVIVGANLTHANRFLDAIAIFDRKIGTYNGAEVWVKPWMPAGYIFYWLLGAPKPLVWRNPKNVPGSKISTLGLVFEDERNPLRSKEYERVFGIGVWNRTNGVVQDTVHTSYNDPTITN